MKTRILLFIIALVMVVSMIPLVAIEANAATSIENDTVFLKQATNYTCTLASATMMIRRTAILAGVENWDKITESSMRTVAWLEGQGLYYKFNYTQDGVKFSVEANQNFTGTYAEKKANLIDLLNKYPQGIVAYNTNQPHAILLTKYDVTTDTFYCADPWESVPKGQIPISQSILSGSGQENKIKGINQYWYVASPTVYPEGTPAIIPANITEGTYYLNNNGYRMYMKSDKKDVANVIGASNGSVDEKFTFTVEKVDSQYKIYPTATQNNYVLHAYWLSNYYDSKGNFTKSGDEIALWSRDSDYSQRWIFEECDGGYLIHPADNLNLSITRTDDNRLYVMANTKATNQIWKLEKYNNSYSDSTNAVIAERIEQALSMYGPNDYFTKNGEKCTTCHNNDNINCVNSPSGCNCLRYVNINGKQVDLFGVQCFGYARYWQQMLFGCIESNTSKFGKLTGPGELSVTMLYVWLYNNKDVLHPGTHLRVLDSNHSIVLLDFNIESDLESSTITYIECNWDLKCGIEPIKTLLFEDFISRYSTLDYAVVYNNYYTEYPDNTTDCSHSYGSSYESNETGHWKTCTKCGEKSNVVGHNNVFQTTAVRHWTKCSTCNYESEKNVHTITDTTIKYNSELHWVQCSVCMYKDESSHQFYNYYEKDTNGHWQTCFGCAYTTASELHTFGSWEVTQSASCTKTGQQSASCTACGHTISEAIPKANHQYSVTTSNGYKVYTCSECRDTYKEPIETEPADTTTPTLPNDTTVADTPNDTTVPSIPDDTTSSSDTDNDAKKISYGSMPELGILLILALILLVGIVLFKKK